MLGRSEFALRELPRRGNSLVIPTNKESPPGAMRREGCCVGNQPRVIAAVSMAIISSSLVGMLPSGPRPAGGPGPFYARAK